MFLLRCDSILGSLSISLWCYTSLLPCTSSSSLCHLTTTRTVWSLISAIPNCLILVCCLQVFHLVSWAPFIHSTSSLPLLSCPLLPCGLLKRSSLCFSQSSSRHHHHNQNLSTQKLLQSFLVFSSFPLSGVKLC